MDLGELQEFIIQYMSSLSFPSGNSPPMRLYMEESVKPVAIHKAPPVPVHWEDQVKEAIDKDVSLGVLEWVPLDVPTTWCSRMVTTAKKDGKLGM